MPTTIDRRALLGTAAGFVLAGTGAWVAANAGEPRVVKVVAKKFVFVPAEIHVRKGESVVLQFTAPEVPMGVNFPDFKTRTDVIPGKATTLAFTPDRAGSFTFVCDVFCGTGHEDMSGVLVVGD
jgi:cytochrome c oxidase subunit 2